MFARASVDSDSISCDTHLQARSHGHSSGLLPDLGVTCVLDVGAHHGEYGEMLRGIGYQGHIVSFEPVPESVSVLRRRAAHDPKWRVHSFALGEENANLPINVTASSHLCSFRAH